MKYARVLPGLALGLASMATQAAIDTSSVTDVIADVVTAGSAVGLAALGMVAVLKGFKWIRKSF
jgi:hypothetical protein